MAAEDWIGDMTDDAEDWQRGEPGDYVLQDLVTTQPSAVTWRSYGTVRTPKQMDSAHLLNCIHLCERRKLQRAETLPKVYRALVREARRRKMLTRS